MGRAGYKASVLSPDRIQKPRIAIAVGKALGKREDQRVLSVEVPGRSSRLRDATFSKGGSVPPILKCGLRGFKHSVPLLSWAAVSDG